MVEPRRDQILLVRDVQSLALPQRRTEEEEQALQGDVPLHDDAHPRTVQVPPPEEAPHRGQRPEQTGEVHKRLLRRQGSGSPTGCHRVRTPPSPEQPQNRQLCRNRRLCASLRLKPGLSHDREGSLDPLSGQFQRGHLKDASRTVQEHEHSRVRLL